jgi:hypothetical protein
MRYKQVKSTSLTLVIMTNLNIMIFGSSDDITTVLLSGWSSRQAHDSSLQINILFTHFSQAYVSILIIAVFNHFWQTDSPKFRFYLENSAKATSLDWKI